MPVPILQQYGNVPGPAYRPILREQLITASAHNEQLNERPGNHSADRLSHVAHKASPNTTTVATDGRQELGTQSDSSVCQLDTHVDRFVW